MDFGGFKMDIFPHKDSGAAICQGEWYKPGSDGVVVFAFERIGEAKK